jgi:hypothetical protein
MVRVTIGKGKRPCDPNRLGAWTVAISTRQITEPQPDVLPNPASISSYAGPQSGPSWEDGSKTRLKTMAKEQHSKIAAKAA